MCGRFTLKTPPLEWGQLLLPLLEQSAISEQWQPRYNIAPTQPIVALAMGGEPSADNPHVVEATTTSAAVPFLDVFRWGLIPGWAAELNIGSSMINARSESIHEKRSFKGPLANRRCLVVADGYYEWQAPEKGAGKGQKKQPFWIHRPAEKAFYMAGIWDVNRKATGNWIKSCAIITTAANDDVSQVHDRMPIILDESSAGKWLLPNQPIDELLEYLVPAPSGSLVYQPVSTVVNNARHEGPGCLAID